jgi:hypothetical protein
LGPPDDLRSLAATRIRARAWNPDDPRIPTRKAFGWGVVPLVALAVGILIGPGVWWLSRRRHPTGGSGRPGEV